MAAEDFVVPEGWTLESWKPDPELGLRASSFMHNGRILIGQVVSNPSHHQLCSLAWLNEDNNLCLIAEIPYEPKSRQLIGNVLVQNFAGQPGIYCSLTLQLREVVEGGTVTKFLEGHFARAGNPGGVSGGPGTLAAQANASRSGSRRPPEIV